MRNARSLMQGLALMVLLAACGKTETVIHETGPIELVADAPLFEGSNTAQGAWMPDMGAVLAKAGAQLGDLRSARIVRATVSGDDLQEIKGITLHLASDKLDMLKVAALTPLPDHGGAVDLVVASEQKGLADHLREGTVTMVADIDLDADNDDDRHVIGSFTIELHIKR